jgi:hypothetical protein
MSLDAVEKIASAVLYEGYLLYPYRRSAVKNQQRFNVGVLYPPRFCEGLDSAEMRTECLATGSVHSLLGVKTRFLQMIDEKGEEREIDAAVTIASIMNAALREPFRFGDRIEGELELGAARVDDNLFLISLSVRNCSNFAAASRDQALARALVSVHSILHVDGGEFVSLLDPPDEFHSAVAACRNAGAWPVLAGEPGERDTMLVSPIVLYDYPQIAPESAGDLFDGTEMDEILALRILTMTEHEKREVRDGEDRARRILGPDRSATARAFPETSRRSARAAPWM